MSNSGDSSQQRLFRADSGVSDTDALQLQDSVRFSGFPKRRFGDIVNGNTGRRFPVNNPVVRVAMEGCGDAEPIDGFFEPAGTEKSINLRILALQRGPNGRVVQDHDPTLCLQLHQRLLQTNSVADRFLHELFNQRLTDCATLMIRGLSARETMNCWVCL